jgi:hypothetical protein
MMPLVGNNSGRVFPLAELDLRSNQGTTSRRARRHLQEPVDDEPFTERNLQRDRAGRDDVEMSEFKGGPGSTSYVSAGIFYICTYIKLL